MRTATAEPPSPVGPLPALLLGVKHVRQITGLGDRTIWRLASCGGMPAPLKIGGRRLWSRDQITNWIARGCPASGR